jgi:hypothetical protein
LGIVSNFEILISDLKNRILTKRYIFTNNYIYTLK